MTRIMFLKRLCVIGEPSGTLDRWNCIEAHHRYSTRRLAFRWNGAVGPTGVPGMHSASPFQDHGCFGSNFFVELSKKEGIFSEITPNCLDARGPSDLVDISPYTWITSYSWSPFLDAEPNSSTDPFKCGKPPVWSLQGCWANKKTAAQRYIRPHLN